MADAANLNKKFQIIPKCLQFFFPYFLLFFVQSLPFLFVCVESVEIEQNDRIYWHYKFCGKNCILKLSIGKLWKFVGKRDGVIWKSAAYIRRSCQGIFRMCASCDATLAPCTRVMIMNTRACNECVLCCNAYTFDSIKHVTILHEFPWNFVVDLCGGCANGELKVRGCLCNVGHSMSDWVINFKRWATIAISEFCSAYHSTVISISKMISSFLVFFDFVENWYFVLYD